MLYGDGRFGLLQLLDIMAQHNCDNLLGLGDLFNVKSQRADALHLLKEFTDELDHREHKLYYVQGQHEFSDPTIMSAISDTAVHMHDKTVTIGDFRCHGLDYQNPVQVEEALRGLPEADVLLTHQVWRDYMGEDRGRAWAHWVPESYQLILTGDYHETKVIKHGHRRIVSPGSLNIQKINERADKHVFVLKEDGELVDVPLRSRNVYGMNIRDEDELEQFIAELDEHVALRPQADVPPDVAKNILRVTYSTTVPNVVPALERAVGDRCHLFWDPKRPVVTDIPLEAQQRTDAVMSGGLLTCLQEFYNDDGPGVLADRQTLWAAEDVNAELDTIFTRTLDETQQDEDQPTG
jgi:DNA repair exonuclease SbcCD nuclease subunit